MFSTAYPNKMAIINHKSPDARRKGHQDMKKDMAGFKAAEKKKQNKAIRKMVDRAPLSTPYGEVLEVIADDDDEVGIVGSKTITSLNINLYFSYAWCSSCSRGLVFTV